MDSLYQLKAALNYWTKLTLEHEEAMREEQRNRGVKILKIWVANEKRLTRRAAKAARPYLVALTRDNSHLSAEQLEELARRLSPGGVHDGGYLALIIQDNDLYVDQLLFAAIFRCNWHGASAAFNSCPTLPISIMTITTAKPTGYWRFSISGRMAIRGASSPATTWLSLTVCLPPSPFIAARPGFPLRRLGLECAGPRNVKGRNGSLR